MTIPGRIESVTIDGHTFPVAGRSGGLVQVHKPRALGFSWTLVADGVSPPVVMRTARRINRQLDDIMARWAARDLGQKAPKRGRQRKKNLKRWRARYE